MFYNYIKLRMPKTKMTYVLFSCKLFIFIKNHNIFIKVILYFYTKMFNYFTGRKVLFPGKNFIKTQKEKKKINSSKQLILYGKYFMV